jgi:hypothetical protein
MNVNCSIDCSLRVGQYVFEASFWLKDWQLAAKAYNCSAIHMVHIGPLCFAVTNLKRLKELYGSKPQPASLDDLADM